MGAVDIDGQIFRCHNLSGHGVLDMAGALEKSCNPYFITLAIDVGGPSLVRKAEMRGFGASAQLADGYRTETGSLPTMQELTSRAATGNFGFGQGSLTATPLQIAALVSSMANGGKAVVPRLVEGTTGDGRTFSSRTAVYSPSQVFTPAAAAAVRDMMVKVVEEGSGSTAKPETGGAGGKTASAQTGKFVGDKEVVHAWFGGFFPAENPRYTIIVLVEGGESGTETAAPVFKEIADGILALSPGVKTA